VKFELNSLTQYLCINNIKVAGVLMRMLPSIGIDCRFYYPAYIFAMPGVTEHAQNDNKGECRVERWMRQVLLSTFRSFAFVECADMSALC
jgi:hypothetical protein